MSTPLSDQTDLLGPRIGSSFEEGPVQMVNRETKLTIKFCSISILSDPVVHWPHCILVEQDYR